MSDSIGKLSVIISADNSELKKGFNDSTKLVREFDISITRMGAQKPQKLNENLKGVTTNLKSLRKDVESTGAYMGKALAAGIASGGTLAAAMIGKDLFGDFAGNLGEVVRDSISIRSEMEQTAAAFEVMTGSAEDSKKVVADLRKLAAESPLTSRNAAQFAKSLLGAGVDKDQLVPTLKMLTDIGQGKADEIGRIVYAYGQIKNAGQLYMQDLHQILNANVPIMPDLAKVVGERVGKPVNVGDIKDYIEEGKVGFVDLVRAMKRLTEEGGRFHGMSDKFSQTFGGQLEQLKDAWDVTKGEFGKALIEELRLVDGMKDLSKYTDRVKTLVQDIRPGIAFIGDAIRAAAQVGSELARGYGVYAETLLTSIAAVNPKVADLVKTVKQLVKDAQEFKIDPEKIIDFAVNLAMVVGSSLDEVWSRGKSMFLEYKKIFESVIGDIREILADTKTVIHSLKTAKGIALDPVGQGAKLLARGIQAAPNDLSVQGVAQELAKQKMGGAVNGGGGDWDAEEKTIRQIGEDMKVKLRAQLGIVEKPEKLDDALSAFTGGLGVATASLKKMSNGVADPGTESLETRQAKYFIDKFKPESERLQDQLKELAKLRSGGFLSESIYSQAAADAMRSASKDMMQQRLPTAMEEGSQAMAEALARATAGQPNLTVEGLLKQLVDLEKARDLRDKQIAPKVPAPVPVPVKLPG